MVTTNRHSRKVTPWPKSNKMVNISRHSEAFICFYKHGSLHIIEAFPLLLQIGFPFHYSISPRHPVVQRCTQGQRQLPAAWVHCNIQSPQFWSKSPKVWVSCSFLPVSSSFFQFCSSFHPVSSSFFQFLIFCSAVYPPPPKYCTCKKQKFILFLRDANEKLGTLVIVEICWTYKRSRVWIFFFCLIFFLDL